MTEQQILDKTIEYLNKYSNCFSNIKTENRYGANYLIAEVNYCQNYSTETEYLEAHMRCLIEQDDKSELSSENYHWGKFDHYTTLYSEFRIAYNIIKDLAQHGTDNEINALG